METQELTGRAGLVTGAARGIGQACALALAKGGASVLVADVLDGSETVRQIRDAGGRADFIRTDVSHSTDVQAMVVKVVDLYGKLDFAVNNAGVEVPGVLTADTAEEDYDRIMSINLKGVWLGMKYEILQFLAQQSPGAIINMSSVVGKKGQYMQAVYSATKHGIIGLTKSAALEYCQQGIRINAVCPGLIHTPQVDEAPKELVDAALKAQPVGRLGEPAEIGDLVRFLVSDRASLMIGAAVSVDGGMGAV